MGVSHQVPAQACREGACGPEPGGLHVSGSSTDRTVGALTSGLILSWLHSQPTWQQQHAQETCVPPNSAIHYSPDDEGINGVYLGKNVVTEASKALTKAIVSVGPKVNVCLHQQLHQGLPGSESYC